VSAHALVLAAQVALAPCTVPGTTGDVQCGHHRVWEDRDARSGRQIDLSIIVLRATETPRPPDALFVLAGGPGQGPSQIAGFVNDVFGDIRRHRDIVLLDLRGTGKSHSLACPELVELPANGIYDADWLSPAALKRCRERLERQADLRLYTTEIAMADLDEVRAALGYEQIDLYGTSYGTRAAQIYMRDFPTRVRAVVMKGAVPLTMAAMPSTHAADGERAWQQLVKRCAADATCAAAYPSLDADFRSIIQRLERTPVEIDAKTEDGKPVRVRLTRGLFGEAFRNLLYSPATAARAPAMVSAIARGDYTSIAPIVLQTRTLPGTELSAGFFLSVTCAEDVPFIRAEDVEQRAAGTFGGPYRMQQQRRACDLWARGREPRLRGQPVRSSIPVLIFSGDQDPVTPPAGGEELRKHLPNARHVVVANNGHAFGSLQECGERLMADFIAAGSAADLDVSCASTIPPVPFVVEKRP
jgi:pimeloyl-ACP methyl ester carboxylesterase